MINNFTVKDFVVDTDQIKIKDALDIVNLFYNLNILDNKHDFGENELFNLSIKLTEKYINKYSCKPIKSYVLSNGWNNYVLLILKNSTDDYFYILTYELMEKKFKTYKEHCDIKISFFITKSACVTKVGKNNINTKDSKHLEYKTLFLNVVNNRIKE